MNTPIRISDLVPGLVIPGGTRVITDSDSRDSDPRGAQETGGDRPIRVKQEQPVGRWFVFAIAKELAAGVFATKYRMTEPLYIERLSWPHVVHVGDDVELKIEILETYHSQSGYSAFVRWNWVLVRVGQGSRVLDLVTAAILEDRGGGGKGSGAGEPIAYKVARAASMLGISRYVLYEAIRDQELRAYRPKEGSDLMILPEDLREWVTRHRATPEKSG